MTNSIVSQTQHRAIVTISGKKASILGLGSNPNMDVECLNLAYQGGINYFFFYNLNSTDLITSFHDLVAISQRENLIISTGTESRNITEIEKYRANFCQQLDLKIIDVFLLEYISPQDDIEKVEKLLDDLSVWKEKKLIRYLGISTHNRELAKHFLNSGKIDVLMHRYNMAHRQAEKEVLPTAIEFQIPVISFTATRWGSLLQSHSDWHLSSAKAIDCYRFVLQNKAVSLCLSSPKTTAELQENLAIFDRLTMSEEEYQSWQQYGDLIYGKGKDSFETQWL